MRRPRMLVLLTLAAVVALAACGSDSDDSSSSTTRSTSGSASGDATEAVVGSDNATLGRIVVNEQGVTVYTLTDDAGNAVACEGSCLEAWPPVLVSAGTEATGGTGVKDVGVFTGPEGDQVTIKGLPVYTFAGDAGPGDTNGEGIASFGGTWRVVKISGGSSGTTDTTSGTPPDYDY